MARRSGAYKGEKRRKEVKRQKKQEEKRQKRLSKSLPDSGEFLESPGDQEELEANNQTDEESN